MSESTATNGQHAPQTTQPTNQGNNTQRRNPQQGGNSGYRPLSEAELNEITGAATRSPGLGKILLSIVRNRNARIVSPETAIGGELVQITAELDRLLHRADSTLTRNLNTENMAVKGTIDMQAVGLIGPLTQFAAELAVKFDFGDRNKQIAKHPEVRRQMTVIREKLNAEKVAADGATDTKTGTNASAKAARSTKPAATADSGEPAPSAEQEATT